MDEISRRSSTSPLPHRATRPLAENPRFLSRRDIVKRLTDHGTVHYLDFFNVIQGVTLAAGGYSLVRVASAGWQASRLSMLIVTLLAAVVAHSGATTGAVLLNLYPSSLDLLLPMGLAVLECFMMYQPGEIHQNPLGTEWFMALAAWQLMAGGFVWHISRNHKTGVYDAELRSIMTTYRMSYLREDYRGAFGSATVTILILAGWWTDAIPDTHAVRQAFLGVTALVFVFVLSRRPPTRRWIYESMTTGDRSARLAARNSRAVSSQNSKSPRPAP